MAGVVLVISLMTIPPNIAMLFTKEYLKIVLGAIAAGFLGTAGGYAISFYAGIPLGATIIFTLVILWIFTKVAVQLIRIFCNRDIVVNKFN
jgi:zinc transport system permease protein